MLEKNQEKKLLVLPNERSENQRDINWRMAEWKQNENTKKIMPNFTGKIEKREAPIPDPTEETLVKKSLVSCLIYNSMQYNAIPGKFCNRLLTKILTEVPISHLLTEFNQPFNR